MKFDKKWLVGFLENSSEFNVSIRIKNNDIKEVLLEFRIFSVDIQILYALKKFFGCGRVLNNLRLVINNLEQLKSILIFFNENSFVTSKKFEFLKFKKCFEIVIDNPRLSDFHFVELEKLS